MNAEKVHFERVLKSKSPNIIWPLLSTQEGLSKWIADDVKLVDGRFVFTWGDVNNAHEIRMADIIGRKDFEYMRFRWAEERFEETYWELRMDKSELTGEYMLLITDFALDYDFDTLEDIWDANLENLYRKTGV